MSTETDPVVLAMQASPDYKGEGKPAERAEEKKPEAKTEPEKEPVVEEKPEPEEKAEVEKVEEKPEEEKVEKPKNHAERRRDRMLEERAYFKAQAEFLQAQLAQQQQQKASPTGQQEQVPQRAAYNSDEEYVDALAEFKIAKRFEALTRQQQEQAQRGALDKFNTRTAEAKKAYDDYDEVVQAASFHPLFATNQYPHVTETVMSSEVGADLIYYLADNPEEATRIANMRPNQAVKELGRIESYIEMALEGKTTAGSAVKAKAPVTKAPAPYSSPKGTGGTTKKTIYDKNLSNKEFLELWNKS
jgi:outer membrane biosynthesis protein TonB